MRYKITKDTLLLKDSLAIVFNACYPDIPVNGTPDYKEYKNAFKEIKIESRLEQDKWRGTTVGCLVSNLASFIYEEENIDAKIFQMLEDIYTYDKFSEFIKDDGNVRGWLKGTTAKPKYVLDVHYLAVFCTLKLIQLDDSSLYLKKIFDSFGIEENASDIFKFAKMFGWEDELLLYVTDIFINSYNVNESVWLQNQLYKLERFINTRMIPIVAERSWLNDVCVFSPRSISDVASAFSGYSMQRFYVEPEFCNENGIVEKPIDKFSRDIGSIRQLITGKTGMGKTMYSRMMAISMGLNYIEGISSEDKELINQKFKAPSDKYVIYIPAYMFSYCYDNSEDTRLWTRDFVKLYFNSTIFLSDIDFDKKKNGRVSEFQNLFPEDFNLNSVSSFINDINKNGQLVFILESFDEIPANMRNAYMNAIENLREEYGRAHIILTSRKLSDDTMEKLTDVLSPNGRWEINPFSEEKQEELICNWDKYFRPGTGIREICSEQIKNPYFSKLGSNPYILSIICSNPGQKLNDSIDRLVKEILKNRIGNITVKISDIERYTVDTNIILSILKEIALRTVVENEPLFDNDFLEESARLVIKDRDMSEKAFSTIFNRIIHVFTETAGIIVPADGADDGFYQFIFDQFRFKLAADKLSSIKNYEEIDDIVTGIDDDETFINLLIPLICMAEDNESLSRILIHHLISREYSDDNVDILNEAIVDLILERYDQSIINTVSLDENSFNYLDIILVMRLLSSDEDNKYLDYIKESNAYEQYCLIMGRITDIP